jgi:hypothetical protein
LTGFDGVLEFFDFSSDLLSFSKGNREEIHLDEDVTEKLGGLLGNRITSQQDIKFLSPFFDFGLILIEGFKTLNIDVWNSSSSCFFNMSSISKNANLNYTLCTFKLFDILWGSLTVPLNLLSGS